MAVIYDETVEPKIGSFIKPDGWALGSKLEASDWDAAAFRIPLNSAGPITSLAVNVIVTGRTWQRRNASYYVRVRIEFVGDGEPSTFTTGWMHREGW